MNTMKSNIENIKANLNEVNDGLSTLMEVSSSIANRSIDNLVELFNDSILDYIKMTKKISLREKYLNDLDKNDEDQRIYAEVYSKINDKVQLMRNIIFDISWNSYNTINGFDITDKEFMIIHKKIIDGQIESEAAMIQDISKLVENRGRNGG